MTTRPRLIPLGQYLLPGLIAVALFGIMAATFLTADFGTAAGFEDVSIVAGIGYALIGTAEYAGENTEEFLVALVLIAILLDAALDGSLMLAKRDDGGDKQ